MSGSTTPNYSFNLPAIGGNQDSWGNLLNANWTAADSVIHNLASGYLPLTGGTLNGGLTVNGNLILNGRINFGNLGAGAHGMEFGWGGSGVIQAYVDGNYVGDLATMQYLSSAYLPLTGGTLNGGLIVGGRLTSNDIMSNTGAFFAGTSGVHYLARSSADGYWRFVEDSTVNLMLDPAGNLTARGQVHGSNVTAMTDRIGELAARVEELTARVADLEALRLA